MPPTSRTAAAAAGDVTPLNVLIQHLQVLDLPTQQQVVCKLLSASAAVASVIGQLCAGKLAVHMATYNMELLKCFTPWLEKHGRLLADLRIELNLSNTSCHEAESAIAAALRKASSAAVPARNCWCSPPGLQIRSYSCRPAVATATLDHLDSWYLTRLDLGRHAPYSSSFALEQLTRLGELTLYEDSADVLLPSLAHLTSLTRVVLVDTAAASISKVKWLPPQIQELQLSLARLKRSEDSPPGLSLGHLTCLTKMTNGDNKPLIIQAGDILPPTLRELCVRDVVDVAPLLQLTNLRRLGMCATTTPAAQLSLLAGSNGGLPAAPGSSGDVPAAPGSNGDDPHQAVAADCSNCSTTIGNCSGHCSSGPACPGNSNSRVNSSRSNNLKHVSLCYRDMQAAAAAAAGWPLLPVEQLELHAAEGILPGHTFAMMGQMCDLKRLDVSGGGCRAFTAAAVCQVTQEQLADILAHLTHLEVLSLRGFGLLSAGSKSFDQPTAQGQLGPAATAIIAAAAGAHDVMSDDTSASNITNTLCRQTSHLSLSSSYDSSINSSSLASSNSSNNSISLASSNQDGKACQSTNTCSSGSSSTEVFGCFHHHDSSSSLQPLMAAVASLPLLTRLHVSSISCGGELLSLDVAAARSLSGATQLTSLQLTDVQLTDAAADALVTGGLTGLRRLLVDNNSGITAAVLPDHLAMMLTGLQELGVLRTGIRASAAVFKARMLKIHPHLHVKSSARGC